MFDPREPQDDLLEEGFDDLGNPTTTIREEYDEEYASIQNELMFDEYLWGGY